MRLIIFLFFIIAVFSLVLSILSNEILHSINLSQSSLTSIIRRDFVLIISYMLTKTGEVEVYAKARIVDIFMDANHNSLMIVKSTPSSMGESDQVSHIKDLPRGNTWTSLRN